MASILDSADARPGALTPYAKPSEHVGKYEQHSAAKNTVRAYGSDWRQFTRWCASRSLRPLPADPQTVSDYFDWLADSAKSVATIERRMSAISQAHQLAGCESPTWSPKVRRTMKGIRREIGRPPHGKAPITPTELQQLLDPIPTTTNQGARDRVMLLLGFASALRRENLVGVDVEHLEWRTEGLALFIPRSKTDQENRGAHIAIAYGSSPETCPVRSLQAWLERAGITSGPVFRQVNKGDRVLPGRLTPQSVALRIKAAGEAAGWTKETIARFAGHSLRAGHITTAAMNGAEERDIMRQSQHRSVMMVRRYIRDANLFRNSTSARLGL